MCVCVCFLVRGQRASEQPSNYGGHGVTVEMRENCNWIMTRQGFNLSLDTSKDSHTVPYALECGHTNTNTRTHTGQVPTCDYKAADLSPAYSYRATLALFSCLPVCCISSSPLTQHLSDVLVCFQLILNV